jgi:hypothetical protein
MSRIDTRITYGGKVVSPTHGPRFTPQKHYFTNGTGRVVNSAEKKTFASAPGGGGQTCSALHFQLRLQVLAALVPALSRLDTAAERNVPFLDGN